MEENKLVFSDILDSPVDERDHIWDNICGIGARDIPDEWVSPWYKVVDQKNSMWCMSYSATALWAIIEYMVSNGKNKLEFSKEFTMFNAKENDGSPKVAGTYGRTIAENAYKQGFCPESFCPTTLKGEHKGEIKRPSQSAYDEALKHKPDGYARIADLNGILTAIYKNGGVFTSLLYYAEMLKPDKGYIGRPSESSSKLGGHSTTWIGYSRNKKVLVKNEYYTGFFIQLNSYGESQGRFGIELVPFDIMQWVGGRYHYTSDKIFREAWTFYYKKDVVMNKYFIDNQPKNVIKDAKPVDIRFKVGSNIAHIDGKQVKMDVVPKVIGGVTFIPVRFMFDAVDCDVKYIKQADGHHLIRGVDRNTAVKVDLNLGYKSAYIDGKEYRLLQAPFVENSRTYVPVRAIGEMLGCKVGYDPVTKEIPITR